MTGHDDGFGNRAEAFEAFDDIPTNRNLASTIGDVIYLATGGAVEPIDWYPAILAAKAAAK